MSCKYRFHVPLFYTPISFEMEFITGLFFPLSSPWDIIRLLLLFPVYSVLLAIYNVSPLHPLSNFPGPKLAAALYFYEAYYDWWNIGTYGKRIKRMHDKYGKYSYLHIDIEMNSIHTKTAGPIVRINPDELHCNDPRFADEIYASGSRVRDKWVHQLNTGAVGPVAVTGFSTVPHELHRVRRGAMNKYFSRQQMLKLEGEVLDFAQRAANKMLKSAGGKPFDIKEALNCFTADVVAQYAFGEPMGFVD